jgi:hypothetical protein
MTNNIVDLEEVRLNAEESRFCDELERRILKSLETPNSAFFVCHAVEMLAYRILTHKDEAVGDDLDKAHIQYFRRCHGQELLDWARFVSAHNGVNYEEEEEEEE